MSTLLPPICATTCAPETRSPAWSNRRLIAHERYASVELLVGIGAVAVDVMQKHLNEAISLKRLAPMKNIDSAVKKAIARRKHRAVRSSISFNIERPCIGWHLADIQADADFACRPVAMALQTITALVQPEIGICWRKREPRIFFDARTEIFEQAVERRIAVGPRCIRHLLVTE